MAKKNNNYNPGDSAKMVQTPAGMQVLNHILGSQGSQKFNGGIAPGGMYGGSAGQTGNPQGGVRPMQFPGSQPQQQGGGHQAVNHSLQQGGGQRSGLSGIPGRYSDQQGGGQQAVDNSFQQGSKNVSQLLRGGLSVQQQGGGQQADFRGPLMDGRFAGLDAQFSKPYGQGGPPPRLSNSYGGPQSMGTAPAGGGQQASMMGGPNSSAGFGALYNQAQAGGQQGGQQSSRGQQNMPGQPSNMNMMANAQQNYAQTQQQAFSPQGQMGQTINPTKEMTGYGPQNTQPISSGVFDLNNWAINEQLQGKTVVGQTDQENYIQGKMGEMANGGARDQFNDAMAPGQPGLMTAMAGSLGGYGQGGYGADGMPSDAFGAQVGAAYNQQGALEAMAGGNRNAREAQGLAASQASQNQYTNELMGNIDSAASSTLSNQLGSVGSQMEAAGLGRSGAGGLAASRMGQQVLGQANRDKMSVLAQNSDRMSAQDFQAQQSMLQRQVGAEDSALNRMQNTGMGVTDAQTARLKNESDAQYNARMQNMQMFGLGTENDQTWMNNSMMAELQKRGIDQGNWSAALGAGQKGYNDLYGLATGITQQPMNYANNNGPGPFQTIGGQAVGGMVGGLFGGQPSNLMNGNRPA